MTGVYVWNEKGTTEIYTDLDTLSLHDALPIYPLRRAARLYSARSRRGRWQCAGALEAAGQARVRRGSGRCGQWLIGPISMSSPAGLAPAKAPSSKRWRWRVSTTCRRSEEHTSELQSLMRISFAVFCLKQQITTTYIHAQPQSPQTI